MGVLGGRGDLQTGPFLTNAVRCDWSLLSLVPVMDSWQRYKSHVGCVVCDVVWSGMVLRCVVVWCGVLCCVALALALALRCVVCCVASFCVLPRTF